MRLRTMLVAVFILALAVPSMANAQQQDAYKITGGGQVIAERNTAGPGDTVGFVAIQTGEEQDGRAPAEGVFQAVGTSEAGREMIIFNGRVTCIEPGDPEARFGGVGRDPRTGTTTAFTVDVTDADEQGNDIVVFQTTDEPCEDGNPVFEEQRLARGNVTIHTTE